MLLIQTVLLSRNRGLMNEEEGSCLDPNKKTKKNAICPCGSGEKYKDCCGLFSNVVPFCDRKSFERAHALWDSLDAFAGHPKLLEDREKAWDFFFEECLYGNCALNEEDKQAFLDWFIMDYPLKKNRRVLHEYAEAHPPSPEEERMLRDWCNSPLSLYRVQEVWPGRGLLMDDLLREGTYELLNATIAMGVEARSLLVTRLLPVGGYYGYAGVLIFIPPFLQKEMLQELDKKLKGFSSREVPPHRGHPSWPEFLLEHGYVLFSALRALRLRWENTLSEDFSGIEERNLFAALTTYVLSDPEEVLRRFIAVPDLVSVREKRQGRQGVMEYVWEWYGSGSGNELKGYLQLQSEYLTLQCFSRSNLDAGKFFIQDLAGDLVVSQRDSFINLEENNRLDSSSPEMDEFLHALFINQSCREWIHKPLPDFKGKTPFQMRMDQEGWEILDIYLNKLEHRQSLVSQEGTDPLDIIALRQSLLLDHQHRGPFQVSDWDWLVPLYRDVADLLEKIAEAMSFTLQQLANALKMWYDFIREDEPLLKKPEAWAGSVAYLISSLDFGEYTQKDLAAYLNVSCGAISSNSIRIKRTLELEQQPGRYRSIQFRAR